MARTAQIAIAILRLAGLVGKNQCYPSPMLGG
jgi:hypothetical protein